MFLVEKKLNGDVMKSFLLLGLTLFLASDVHANEEEFFEPVLRFEDVRAIAFANCATSGCHDGGKHFSLRTREDFFSRKPRPLNAMLRRSMPKNNPDFIDSPDGAMLAAWLQGSQED